MSAVRFLGRETNRRASRDRSVVEDSKGHTVYVDSSSVDIDIEINGLYTFVGEIVRKVINLSQNKKHFINSRKKNTVPTPCVRARGHSTERDIDMKLYEDALRVRRSYLQNIINLLLFCTPPYKIKNHFVSSSLSSSSCFPFFVDSGSVVVML